MWNLMVMSNFTLAQRWRSYIVNLKSYVWLIGLNGHSKYIEHQWEIIYEIINDKPNGYDGDFKFDIDHEIKVKLNIVSFKITCCSQKAFQMHWPPIDTPL